MGKLIAGLLAQHPGIILSSLGGVAGIVIIVLKGVEPIIHFAIQKALANPKYGKILIQYRSQIEMVFDEIDKDIKAELESAAQPPLPLPPAQTPTQPSAK